MDNSTLGSKSVKGEHTKMSWSASAEVETSVEAIAEPETKHSARLLLLNHLGVSDCM